MRTGSEFTMRIVVAMSGGVDSSVAAALLAAEGHDVIGLSMQLYDQSGGAAGDLRFGSCCTLDDLSDARRVAGALGFPHYIVNFERRFDEEVVSDFVREYVAGRTPIPCVHCNGELKFASLVDRAHGLGASAVATGHYAQVEHDAASNRFRLKRAVDRHKDQSYFLFSLTQAQLAHARFPVGTLHKDAVREEARRLGLRVADKPDSQELCFVAAGAHAAFVERRAGKLPAGPVRHRDGRVLGGHDGVHRFTIGQRKGLGVSSPIPLYVVDIDADTATVTVGPRSALDRISLTASKVNWIAGQPPGAAVRASARIRHRHQEAPATITPEPGARAHVVFDTPQAAITPGQAVVFYDGEYVLGGGWID
ncbi:MAG TPA: tRNA 2-thiouridine(34) synthase MnmA [Vicinamibacterales bacterium]|nr:tRNA 2-thiouridine(34) synthase MnmA [Vicinamibacterales bacterium]